MSNDLFDVVKISASVEFLFLVNHQIPFLKIHFGLITEMKEHNCHACLFSSVFLY